MSSLEDITSLLPASGPHFLALRNKIEDQQTKNDLDRALSVLVQYDLGSKAAPDAAGSSAGARPSDKVAPPLPDYEETISVFGKQSLLSPRGSYDVRLFDTCIVVQGKFNKSAHDRGLVSYPPGVSAPFGAVRADFKDVHSILYLKMKNR